MRCTFRQLEIFVQAAQDCNFARAAERLGISQPAVSDHICALERNIGSKLFLRRRGTTAQLTAAGNSLCKEAGAVLDHAGHLFNRTAAARGAISLRVFAGPHIFERVLRRALPAFHRDHPNIVLNIFSELSADSLSGLIERCELDIAVFTTQTTRNSLGVEVLCNAPCVVVASKTLVRERYLTPAQMSRLPFVLPLEGTPAARWVDGALSKFGIVPETVVGRTQFLDVQQKMVESGEAAALLFREDYETSPVRDRLWQLTPDTLDLQRTLLMRPGEQRPEVNAVAAFVRRVLGHGQSAAAAGV